LGPAATGAIATGTTATSTSTIRILTTQTLIETPIETRTVELALARATGGSIIASTAVTRLTAIGELQVNTVAVARVALAAEDALGVLVAQVASEGPAVVVVPV